MKINVYFNFNGNAREAIEFYEGVFETKAKVLTFGEAPQDENYPLPEEMKNLVMHGMLEFEGLQLMFSDIMPGMEFTVGNNLNIALIGTEIDKLKVFFERLSEGGNITMPLEETFWAPIYGFVIDKYGVCWQVSGEK